MSGKRVKLSIKNKLTDHDKTKKKKIVNLQ